MVDICDSVYCNVDLIAYDLQSCFWKYLFSELGTGDNLENILYVKLYSFISSSTRVQFRILEFFFHDYDQLFFIIDCWISMHVLSCRSTWLIHWIERELEKPKLNFRSVVVFIPAHMWVELSLTKLILNAFVAGNN